MYSRALSVVESTAFFLILVNTLFIGYDLDVSVAALQEGKSPPEWLSIAEIVFVVAFSLESVVKLALMGTKFFTADTKYWNVFDLVLVFTAALDLMLTSYDFTFARIFRLFRVMRTIRLIRAVPWVRKLRLMVASTISSLVSLMWGMMLLLFLLYVFGVLFLQGVVHHLEDVGNSNKPLHVDLTRYYGSLEETIITLYKSFSGGADWQDLGDPLLSVGRPYLYLFCFFVAFIVFGILNVLTAIFVEAANSIADVDRDLVIQEYVTGKDQDVNSLRTLFLESDIDGSGEVTKDEFEQTVQRESVQVCLGSIGISATQARGLFTLLDLDEDGRVDINEFVTGMMRMRGGATGVHMATIMYENKRIYSRLSEAMRFWQDSMDSMFLGLGLPQPERLEGLARKTTMSAPTLSNGKRP